MAGNELRDMRAQEPWLMYDSVVVGPGAGPVAGNAGVTGWFNTWKDFADNGDKIEWFGVKRTGAPDWASNCTGEREDFSLYFYQAGLEIIVPPGIAGVEQLGVDLFYPLSIPWQLMTFMNLSLKLSGVDVVLTVPASHAPSSTGLSGAALDGVAGPVIYPGSSGVPAVQNSWRFADPQPIARQGSWVIKGKVERPLQQFLQAMPGPGNKQFIVPPAVPGAEPTTALMPNWTVLRMWLRGYRNVQFRGARSSG